MEYSDVLLTIAEVATAFAGFTGLISALRHKDESRLALSAWQLRGIIENCLFAIGFALLPILLRSYGIAGTDCWQISSAVLLPSWLVAAALALRRLRLAVGSSIFGEFPTSMTVSAIFFIVFACALSVNISGAFPPLAAALYLTGLVCPLFTACIPFLVFVTLSFTGQAED